VVPAVLLRLRDPIRVSLRLGAAGGGEGRGCERRGGRGPHRGQADRAHRDEPDRGAAGGGLGADLGGPGGEAHARGPAGGAPGRGLGGGAPGGAPQPPRLSPFILAEYGNEALANEGARFVLEVPMRPNGDLKVYRIHLGAHVAPLKEKKG